MINNRGILSTTDLLSRQQASARSNARPEPLPSIDNKQANTELSNANTSSSNGLSEMNAKQLDGINQANAQDTNMASQASDLVAGGPAEAQTNINKEASKEGHKTDPGAMNAEVPKSDPKAADNLESASINSSEPQVSQDASVPNEERSWAMRKVEELAIEYMTNEMMPKDQDTTTSSEAAPQPKMQETPEVSTEPKNPVPPRQQFHRMPEIETPNSTGPNARVPQIKMPNAKMPGTTSSPKMRMPSLRIPKMR